MAPADKFSVAINGYGVIGKPVTDAVACRDDMAAVGVCNVATEWPPLAVRGGYAMFGASGAQVEANASP